MESTTTTGTRAESELARGTEVTINPATVLCYGLSAGPWVVRAVKPSPDFREAKKDRTSRIWVEVSDPSGETWSLPREDMEETR